MAVNVTCLTCKYQQILRPSVRELFPVSIGLLSSREGKIVIEVNVDG